MWTRNKYILHQGTNYTYMYILHTVCKLAHVNGALRVRWTGAFIFKIWIYCDNAFKTIQLLFNMVTLNSFTIVIYI